MPRAPTGQQSSAFDHSILVRASPESVLGAFFDPAALAAWWLRSRSVTTPRPLGIYAVEWEPTPEADDILGRLGGVFYGIVMEYKAGRELFVADAWWLPPDGDPIGPMSLQVLLRGGGLGLPAARPAVRVRRDPALAALLQRDRARLAHVAGGAQGVRREDATPSESTSLGCNSSRRVNRSAAR